MCCVFLGEAYITFYAVVYKEKGKLREAIISNPTDFPDVADQSARVQQIEEPVVSATIIVPEGSLYNPQYSTCT